MLNKITTKLQAKAFEEGKSIRFDVPAGKVIKGFMVQVKGYVAPTFTGSPVLEPHGIMAALISSIAYYDDRGNALKKVSPEWMRYQARYLVGQPAIELYKTNATSLGSSPSKGTLATPFAIGTTGQSVALASAVDVSFEDNYSDAPSKTFYDVGENVTNYIEISCRQFKDIQQYGETLITACTGSIDIEITLYELDRSEFGSKSKKVIEAGGYEVFRQVEITPQFTGSVNDYPVDLPRQGRISNIRFAIDDTANRTRIDYDKASNVRIKIVKEGTQIVADSTLLNLMYENMSKRNIDDVVPATANLNFRNNSVYGTELETAGISQLQALLTLPSTMSFSPAIVKIGICDILKPFLR